MTLYSDLYLKKRQSDKLILAGFAITVFFIFSVYNLFSGNQWRASASRQLLKQISLVNVAVQEVGIFWETSTPEQGWVIYGESPTKLEKIAFDEQDTDIDRQKRLLHYVLLRNLKPDSLYYYKIVSGNRLIGENTGEAFTLRTARKYSTVVARAPAFGKVIMPNNQSAANTFVFIYYENCYPFLAITKSSGEWLIPLQYGVDKTDNDIVLIENQKPVTLYLTNNTYQTTIQSLVKNLSPLPKTIILGTNYQFLREQGEVLPATTSRNLGDKVYDVELLYPQDGAVIPGAEPLIRGKGVPSKEVVVNINSRPPVSIKTVVDTYGSWRAVVKQMIPPGVYQIIVTTVDNSGKTIGFRRRFIIAKSGEMVLGDATGSARISPSPVITVYSPTPTATPIYPAVVSLSPTNTYVPTTTPPPPTSGVNDFSPYFLVGAGLVIIGVGIMLFL